MKTVKTFAFAVLALCAAHSFAANTHTVTFRRMNGTVLKQVDVEHGANATSLAPAVPDESGMTAQSWDHADWLANVTNDVTCWALYEAETAKSPSTSIASQSVANRETPYSLEEYFQMYDNLAWSDEFSGTSLSAGYGSGKNWQNDTEKNRSELQTYTSGSNHSVSDGTLKLTCKRESSTKITSARINTKGKVAFLKGRCEIRAKITKAKGAFPAFWTMGSNRGWPWGGEIDVFEQLNGSDWITGSLHMPLYPNSYSDQTIESGGGSLAVPEDGVHWGDGFHRIGLIVNERDLVWYIDDHIFQRMDIRDSKYDILRNDPQYILLNYAFGGNWSGVTNMSQSAAMNFTSEDFEIDYCRIFTNTNANNTVARAESEGARLSGPVKATVWRGWQMNWGKSGSSYYTGHLIGRENAHIRAAMREYFGRDNADIVTFLTRTTANSGGDNIESPVDVPGYTAVYLSPNSGRGWTDWDKDSREKVLSTVLFNNGRFSKSDSAVGTLQLSNDYSFTNGCAVVAELVERDTGAKVKIVSALVSSKVGTETSGSVASQGFDTLISKLNAMKDEKVVLLLQGWNADCLSYIDSKVKSELSSSYSKLGQYTQGYPDYQYQSAWVTANYQASAEQPAPLSVLKSNGQASGVHTNQSFCATVLFEAPPAIEYGQLDMSGFAKKMTVTFSGVQSGTTLTDFPVLVKLSTAITGFSYSDFQQSNGADLRFADSTGKLLPHEIDTWNPSGVSTVWVKVPSLTQNTTITACWGKTGELPEVAAKDVWDDNYVGVWHLGESALPLKESTGISTPFSSKNNTVLFGQGGAIGGSVDFSSGTSNNYLAAADDSDLDGFDDFTVEMWTYQEAYRTDSNYAALIAKRDGAYNGESFFAYQNNSGNRYPTFAFNTNSTSSARTTLAATARPEVGAWTHNAFTRNAGTGALAWYLDGVSKGTGSAHKATIYDGSTTLKLGGGGGQQSFPGRIDEVRISKVARSAAWVKATHDTIADDNFATYAVDGAESQSSDMQLDTAAYEKSMDVTFSGYSGATLTDFPVLVKLSTSINGFSYGDFTLPNGGDLRFADSTGKLLPHEIDTWNESGVSTVWVKVPRLTAAGKIKAYYGCTGTPQAVNPKDVWDDNYVGVWHLGESAVPMKESSETTSDFTTTNGTGIAFASQGVVGGSIDFSNGNKCSLVAPDHDLLDGFSKFTIEVWTMQEALGTNLGILSKRNSSTSEAAYYILQSGSQAPLYMATNMTTSALWMIGPFPTVAAWNHLAYTIDTTLSSDNVRSYKNGSSPAKATKVFPNGMVSNARDLVLGNLGKTAGNSFNGKIDEVRISNVVRSGDWIKATHDTVMDPYFATCAVAGAEPERILTINVASGASTTLNASLVTEYITNIVKTGAGTLVASSIPSYTGVFTIEEGVYAFSNAGDFGAASSGVIDVKSGASLEYLGGAANVLSGKTVNLYGAKAASAAAKVVFSNTENRNIGSNVSVNLKDSDELFYISTGKNISWTSGMIDLGGHELRLKATGTSVRYEIGATFTNGGSVVYEKCLMFAETYAPTLAQTGPSSATLRFENAALNLKKAMAPNGWNIVCSNSYMTGNTVKFPLNTGVPNWDGDVQFLKTSSVAYYGGGWGVSNTVFNMKGAVSGSGTLNVGPGWLNLHNVNNTYSGSVTVNGQNLTSSNPVLAGGGGIGLWNGAACFPNASSVTFTNTARLAFMDNTACTVPNVKFVALAGETQSISGGVYTARSTMAGFVKEGEGTLVIDSPVSVTGLADVKAGTLKIANLIDFTVQDQALMMAPLPQLPNLKFASGTTLDLSDNLGFAFTDIQGSPSVTNSGVFGVIGKWTLTSTNDVLKVRGENATYSSGSAAGVIGFAAGSTFDLADETAFRAAVAAAGADGLLVAEANWIMEPSQSAEVGITIAMPTPAQGVPSGWSMVRGSDGRSVYLRYDDPPASGYAAWAAENGITGEGAAAEKETNGIKNGVRYAFDIDPTTSDIGTPIIQIERDANGNPCVRARDLASGRDDVTFGILATESLTDWSNAVLIPMKKFESDSLWKPTASEDSAYVFPAKMFFKYSIEIQ